MGMGIGYRLQVTGYSRKNRQQATGKTTAKPTAKPF
jgi:hypothetical protein